MFFVAAISSAALGVGCSGASTQDVLNESTTSSATSSGASSTSGASTSASSSSGASSGGSTSSGGLTPDAGPCAAEKEPNDGKDTANTLAPSLCGSVSSKDKKDFLTFKMKPSTKTLAVNFSGRVHLRVDVGSRPTVDLGPDSSGVVPFVPGETYMIEVTAISAPSDGSEVKWQVTILEQ